MRCPPVAGKRSSELVLSVRVVVNMWYDLLIVGNDPAGVQAALTAARAGLSVGVVWPTGDAPATTSQTIDALDELTERIAKLTKDEAILKNHAADPVTIGNTHRGSEELVEALAGKLAQVPWNVREQTRVPLGSYKGLKFGLIVHPQFPLDVYLEGEITRTQGLSREHQGPRAILNAIERIAGNYRLEIERFGQEKSIAESQLRDYLARLGREFAHEGLLK